MLPSIQLAQWPQSQREWEVEKRWWTHGMAWHGTAEDGIGIGVGEDGRRETRRCSRSMGDSPGSLLKSKTSTSASKVQTAITENKLRGQHTPTIAYRRRDPSLASCPGHPASLRQPPRRCIAIANNEALSRLSNSDLQYISMQESSISVSTAPTMNTFFQTVLPIMYMTGRSVRKDCWSQG